MVSQYQFQSPPWQLRLAVVWLRRDAHAQSQEEARFITTTTTKTTTTDKCGIMMSFCVNEFLTTVQAATNLLPGLCHTASNCILLCMNVIKIPTDLSQNKSLP